MSEAEGFDDSLIYLYIYVCVYLSLCRAIFSWNIGKIICQVKLTMVVESHWGSFPCSISCLLSKLEKQTSQEWRLGPMLRTLCEHFFVSYAIRMLKKQANQFISSIKANKYLVSDDVITVVPAHQPEEKKEGKLMRKWGINKFVLLGILAYVDGRLCHCIPNPIARRIVSGFLLSFLDKKDDK